MFSLCLIYDNAVKNPTRIYASTLSWLSRLCTIPSCPQTINSIKKPVIRHNELKETYFVIINAIKNVQKPNAKNFQSKNASAKINPADAAYKRENYVQGLHQFPYIKLL